MILDRPIVSFDLEVTGFSPEDHRIVELAAIKLLPDGRRIEKFARINPERPIPPEATAVHGIKDEDVADAPTFARIARGLWKFLDGADYTGYNIRKFDVPFLAAEFERAGAKWPAEGAKLIDAYTLVVRNHSRNLAWALKEYTGETLENAHSALADSEAALKVLQAQAAEYGAMTIQELDALQRDPTWVDADGKFIKTDSGIAISFGKHEGTLLEDLAGRYMQWMLDAEFSSEVKQLLRDELQRRRHNLKVVSS